MAVTKQCLREIRDYLCVTKIDQSRKFYSSRNPGKPPFEPDILYSLVSVAEVVQLFKCN